MMNAAYRFADEQLRALPLTMEFTATLPEWKKLSAALVEIEKQTGSYEPLKALQHCVSNLVKAIEDATGHGYRTRGYTYQAEQDTAEPDLTKKGPS
jgi:hypothetical protein